MHATKMKMKKTYTSPVTQRATVELEGGFCGSITQERTITVKSSTQEYEEIKASDGFDGTGEDAGFSITWK